MARGRTTTSDDLTTLQMALVGYEMERQKIDEKIKEIRARLGGRRAPAPSAAAGSAPAQPRKRNLSAAARKRIADAQKRRWAEHRKKAAQSKTAKKAAPRKASEPAAKAADKA